jgi:sulfopyruvate decarboxylase TPP-binding subunit
VALGGGTCEAVTPTRKVTGFTMAKARSKNRSSQSKSRPESQSKTQSKTRREQTAVGQDMTTADAAVAALTAHGIDTIYALPGVHNDDFFDALARNSEIIRTVHPRHEQGAGYMALGAALATGKAQAYCVVPGPGLLNSAAALLTAYGTNAPVLAIVGQIPEPDIGKGFGHLHEIGDQAGIIARLVDWSARIRSPNDAPRLIAKAMQSMFGAGPDRCGPSRRCRCVHPRSTRMRSKKPPNASAPPSGRLSLSAAERSMHRPR